MFILDQQLNCKVPGLRQHKTFNLWSQTCDFFHSHMQVTAAATQTDNSIGTIVQRTECLKNTRLPSYLSFIKLTKHIPRQCFEVIIKALSNAAGISLLAWPPDGRLIHTLLFSLSLSFRVKVSALAITGTMLTFPWRAFMNSTSKGFNLQINNQNFINGYIINYTFISRAYTDPHPHFMLTKTI